MIRWCKQLYVSKGARRGTAKMKKKLEKAGYTPGYYLITLAQNQADQLDIISSGLLVQKRLYDACPPIVGISKSYEEALELIRSMTEDVYKKTGTANLRAYLEQLEYR